MKTETYVKSLFYPRDALKVFALIVKYLSYKTIL